MTQQKSHWKFETIICFWSKPSLISPLRFISVFQNYVLFSLWSGLDINRITGIILISSFQFELPAAYTIHFKRKQKVKLFYQLLTILKSVPNNIKDTENCFCEENCHERKQFFTDSSNADVTSGESLFYWVYLGVFLLFYKVPGSPNILFRGQFTQCDNYCDAMTASPNGVH